MGRHSVPRGEKSSYGKANGAPSGSPQYDGRHRAPEPKPVTVVGKAPTPESRLRFPKWLGGK